MRWYGRLPIVWKLTLGMAGASTLVVLLACGAFVFYDAQSYRGMAVSEYETMADVVASGSAAALEFEDEPAAQNALNTLASVRDVTGAHLHTRDGRRLAIHPVGSTCGCAVLSQAQSEDLRVESGDRLTVTRRVRSDGEVAGVLVLHARLGMLAVRRANIVGMGAAVFLLALVGSLLVSWALGRALSRPLVDLADAARGVSASRDYAQRVAAPSRDEVGQLAGAFNDMLGEVERHQRELQQRVDQLQQETAERRRTREALRRSEEMLLQVQRMEVVGQLAGGVAHDFNNILTAIRGQAELALRGIDPDRPEWKRVQEILTSTDRASRLTRQLLAFGRRQILEPVVLDLGDVVRGMRGMLERLIGEDIQIETVCRPGLTRVRVDRGQIEQVLLNLVLNARDAMPRGGKVRVEVASVVLDEEHARLHPEVSPGPRVMLAVDDEGVGMDAATLARIFEPFFTQRPDGTGTGLGLSTVYGVVRQSGGHIDVRSEPGKGSSFRVYLPPASGAVAEEPAAPALTRLSGHETVLVVEDEAPVRDIVRASLEHHGYTVMTVAGPDQAIAVFGARAAEIDLVLTDVVMPGMSGRDLAERLRAQRPGLPVLFMSGYSEHQVVRDGEVAPGIDLIQKPFSGSDLARRIRGLLDARPAPSPSPSA